MIGMKVSVSLPEEDLAFLDTYVRSHGCDSRSAALHEAIRLLRSSELAAAYEDAWRDWEVSGDAEAWSVVTGDGLEP